MSDEAAAVNMFLIVRVFLVGGIFYAYPRISRKGLVFGTYVGEAAAEGAEAQSLLRSWSHGCFALMALSLFVGLGISLAGWPVPGNLTGTTILLLGAPVMYLMLYGKSRKLAPPVAARQAEVAAAPLSVDESRGEGLAKLALVICVLTGIATAVYATAHYEALPDRIPTISSLLGITEELSEKSTVGVLYVPTLNLVLSTSFALVAVLIAGAKRSVRGGSGGRSVEAQNAFRTAYSQTFSGMALFICLLLALLSVQMIRMALSQTHAMGLGLGVAAGAMIAFALASLVRLMRGHGQGGSHHEEGSVEAPLTGALADNTHWILGVIYVNREDPSILVEDRFGLGYTLNFANPKALLFTGAYLVLMLGLVVLALTGAVS